MKNFTVVSLAVMLFSFTSVNAQTTFGIRAGVNNSSLKGETINTFNDLIDLTDGYAETRSRTGFYAGGYVQVPVSDIVSIESGAYYSQKGYSLKGNFAIGKNDFLNATASANLQSHYIDVPLMVNVKLTEGLFVYGGPQVSYLVNNNLDVRAGALGINVLRKDFDVTSAFNRTDISLVGGAGYEFENGFSINAGYDHGLQPVDNNNMLKSYNRTVKVGVGFKF